MDLDKLTLTQVRYWYFHQTEAKQKEIQEAIGFHEEELKSNSVFEQMRDKYTSEIEEWFSN